MVECEQQILIVLFKFSSDISWRLPNDGAPDGPTLCRSRLLASRIGYVLRVSASTVRKYIPLLFGVKLWRLQIINTELYPSPLQACKVPTKSSRGSPKVRQQTQKERRGRLICAA